MLTTWQRGRVLVTRQREQDEGSFGEFGNDLHELRPPLKRVLALRLAAQAKTEVTIDVESACYFLSTIELRAGDAPGMTRWRKRLFVATSHITSDAAQYFGLPRDRTVIMGSRIDF